MVRAFVKRRFEFDESLSAPVTGLGSFAGDGGGLHRRIHERPEDQRDLKQVLDRLRTRGWIGRADSKAMMCLALALPVAPSFLAPLWQPPSGLVFYPFPIAILVNSFLLSIGSAVFLLARNLIRRASAGRGIFQGFEHESILRKALVLLTSYKTSFNVLQSKTYLYPAEEVSIVDSKPVRQFHLVASAAEERNKLLNGLESYKEQGLFSDGVWVTPGLPHMVFLTASLLVTVIIGDLMMWLFFRAVGY